MRKLVCILFGLWLGGWLMAEVPSQDGRLTLLSYNISNGTGTDGRRDLSRLAEIIRNQRADVVLLQQVDVGTRRNFEGDQATDLARLLGMQVFFAKAYDTDGGAVGNAILSRLPLENPRVLGRDRQAKTGFAVAEVAVPLPGKKSRKITVISAQLSERMGEQLEQAKAVSRMHTSDTTPTIWGGDFRADPTFVVWRHIHDHWAVPAKQGPALTTPADAPEHENDFFVFSKGAVPWVVREYRVIPEKNAATHYPVLLVLGLRDTGK